MKSENKGEVVPLREPSNRGGIVRDEPAPQSSFDRKQLEAVAANSAALDGSVTFILNVIFGTKPNKMELRIARAMFSPTANVVLIPRERPTLACALSIDEFFARDDEVLKYESSWRETMRSHDIFAESKRQTRIKVQVILDAEASSARHVDLIFTMRGASPTQYIASCTIVFDEAYRSRSPATLY